MPNVTRPAPRSRNWPDQLVALLRAAVFAPDWRPTIRIVLIGAVVIATVVAVHLVL